MKKKTVAKLKVTRKLEDILPAFFILFCRSGHHNKKKLPPWQPLLHIPHLVSTEIYQRFFKFIDDFSTYISDFFIISTVRHNISTYRHSSTTYSSSIPRHHNKKKLPSGQLLFHIPHPVSTGIYQRFFKYIDDFSTYIGDFFIISTVRHRISTYRHSSTLKTHNIPYPPSNLLPNSTIKKIINKIASIFNATYATLKTA